MRASSAAKGAAVALLSALPAALAFRGFTVDDALVSARVATHLAAGAGYRFNTAGPVVDAVTPLGWANLLASFGPAPPLGMLERGREVGLAAWLLGAAALGALGPVHLRGRATLAGALLLSAPLGAWASSGMETGLVTALATLGLIDGALGVVAAGVAAGLRPELLAWASVLAAGSALVSTADARGRVRALLLRLPLALAPAALVACLRKSYFGSFAPLAVVAKPSDLAHGLFYAVGAAVGTGIPLLLVAPRAISRADARTRVLLLAVVAHLAALVLVGGDWMALYRLAVPMLPTAALAAARLAGYADPRPLAFRSLVAALGPLWVAVHVAWPGRLVLGHRVALVERGREALRGASAIASLDVGWVGAATDATLIDLAGITDPLVARLPGGHTSKRIGNGLLENRAVDAAVLLLAPGRSVAPRWQDSQFARAVEGRVAGLPVFERFRVRGVLALGGTTQQYLVVTR
jgi:hypothetical protein